MKFRLDINMDGEAFNEPGELTRICQMVGRHVIKASNQTDNDLEIVKDNNGNTVGTWRILR